MEADMVGGLQRAVMARIGLLSEKLYMIVASQQVMPGDKPLGKPDMQQWRDVLVRCLSLGSHFFCTCASVAPN
jgi:hypothetical protein